MTGTRPTSLEVGRRGRSTRVAAIALPVGLLALAGGFVAWYANSPDALPTSDREITASGAVGQPIYVGLFTPPDDFDRTLELSGVKVHTVSDAPLTVTPMLCRGGTLGVTTDPGAFCTELVDPEGQTFGEGDAIVVEVVGESAASATVDPVRLGFREGLQWGTEEAGTGAVVRILGRDDAAAPDVDPSTPTPTPTPSETPTTTPSDGPSSGPPTDDGRADL